MSHKFLKYTVILLLLAFSPFQIILHVASVLMLAFFFNKIKPVYAYEDYTHWGLTSIAIYRLKGMPQFTSLYEINNFLGPVESIDVWFGNPDHYKRNTINNVKSNIARGTQGILWGSIAEDYLGDGLDLDSAIVQNHYYNPVTDGGLSDWEGAKDVYHLIGNASVGGLVRHFLAPNPGSATSRAQRHWELAKRAYIHGSIRDAYTLLGRVIHLLEDMTEPAHTRNDNHLGAMIVNFPEKNDHLYWTTYEKWCDSVSIPISEDSLGKSHPFKIAKKAGLENLLDSKESGLSQESRKELARDPELLKKYRNELQAGKLHIDFMNFARYKGWDIDPDHDYDKSNEFYFKMAKGGIIMNEAIQSHNLVWVAGHHSPLTNDFNLEEKVSDQWSVVLRSPMIRDRWIKTGRIRATTTMKEFLDAFEKEGYYINEKRGDSIQPGVKEILKTKWIEGHELAEKYLQEKLGVSSKNITVAEYLELIQQSKEDSRLQFIQGEVKKYFPYLSSDFTELFNNDSLPSSWSLLWGQESLNLKDKQVGGDLISGAYSIALNDRIEEYLKQLALDTASKWFSEDTIPGNLTCPQTYPDLKHLLGEDENKTTALVKQGLIYDAWNHLVDKQGNKVTGEIIKKEMERWESAWTNSGREETYINYPFMDNTIFPEDKNKNLWEMLYRRRYRFTVNYVKEIAKDRFPKVTELAAALIQAFYDNMRHVDIRRVDEKRDSEGSWRNQLITVEKQEGDEGKWSLDLWIENCGGVKEDMEVKIGEVPEGWKVEVTKIEGCSGIEGEMIGQMWVGTIKDVESTPKELSDKGNVNSRWFYEGITESVLGHPYDPPFGVNNNQNRGAKITVEIIPSKMN